MKEKHYCACIGCNVETKPNMLMCREHWFQLPRNIRDEVWRTVRLTDRGPYWAAVKSAIKYLRANPS